MQFIKFRKYLKTVLLLIITAMIYGCGGGGGGDSAAPASASVTVVSLGGGEYSIQGNSLSNVSGLQFTITYDSANLSSPTVTQGSLIAGALLASNTGVAGEIKIACVTTTPFSGTGQIVKISFATHTGTPTVTINSVEIL